MVHAARIEASASSENVARARAGAPRHGFNRLLVSVTICAPGESRCATIDGVMLDTGSVGLRLEAFATPRWLRLPPMVHPDGGAMGECVYFTRDQAWGRLYRADVRLGGVEAAGLPIQIIDEPDQARPAACALSGVDPTSNGTLGVGPQRLDCPGDCRQSRTWPGYFRCDERGCAPIAGAMPPALRLPNPILSFTGHDNGIVFDFPEAPVGGAAAIAGTVTLGVAGEDAAGLDPAHVLRLDPRGGFVTVHDGRSYPDSVIDSGASASLARDDAPRCVDMDWAFCATPERELDATLVGADGVSLPARMRIGDYRAILASGLGASGSATATASGGFVWGAPFFFGRRVILVVDGQSARGLQGPFFAFAPHRAP